MKSCWKGYMYFRVLGVHWAFWKMPTVMLQNSLEEKLVAFASFWCGCFSWLKSNIAFMNYPVLTVSNSIKILVLCVRRMFLHSVLSENIDCLRIVLSCLRKCCHNYISSIVWTPCSFLELPSRSWLWQKSSVLFILSVNFD